MSDLPELLTTRETAELLRLQPHTLIVWRNLKRNADTLPWIKIGRGRCRYRREDVLRFIEMSEVNK